MDYGLKYIITPLVPEYGEIYYLWSGLYMEEGAKELVLQAFESKMKNHPEYDQLSSELSALPESSSERIFEIRDKIAVLGSILCKLIGGSALKPVTERNAMMISRLLTHLEEDFLKIEEVLQQLAGTFSAADLYAFAKENDEGQFKVNYAAGKEAHLLLNAVFSQGDGFWTSGPRQRSETLDRHCQGSKISLLHPAGDDAAGMPVLLSGFDQQRQKIAYAGNQLWKKRTGSGLRPAGANRCLFAGNIRLGRNAAAQGKTA